VVGEVFTAVGGCHGFVFGCQPGRLAAVMSGTGSEVMRGAARLGSVLAAPTILWVARRLGLTSCCL
jgi:hypothetical protein